MSDPFIAEIKIFAGNFAPRGWAMCDGQLMSIAQNTALFSLVGTIYGGDGRTVFGLPNLKGRAPVHVGNGPGLPSVGLGQSGGVTNVTLNTNQMPSHDHALIGSAEEADRRKPASCFPADGETMYGSPANLGSMAAASLTEVGGGQPHENRQPYLAMTFIIALTGIYPSRS